MKLRIAIAIAGAGLLALQGCASITTGQDQTVSIQTPNCPAASCELTNKEGTYYVTETPGTVTVNRVCGKLTVQCSSEGVSDYIMSVSSSVKAMTFGNIIFGGFIGMGVDAATGAACEYPALIPVPMECGGGSPIEEIAHETPEKVLESAEKLDCVDLAFIGAGAGGDNVYTARCEGTEALLTCGEEACRVSEYETESGEAIGS